MRATDHVAGRAHDVIFRMLKNSNPIFQTIAQQIIAEDHQPGPSPSTNYLPPDLPQTVSGPPPMAGAGFDGEYPEQYPGMNLGPLQNYPSFFDPHSFGASIYPQVAQSQTNLQPALAQSHAMLPPVQSQDDIFHLTNWASSPPAYFNNPFNTSFDQYTQLGMLDPFASIAGPSGSIAGHSGSQYHMPAPVQQTQGQTQNQTGQDFGPYDSQQQPGSSEHPSSTL